MNLTCFNSISHLHAAEESHESLTLTDAINSQYALSDDELYGPDLISQFRQKLPEERLAMYTNVKGINSVYYSKRETERSTITVLTPQVGVKPILQLPKTAKKVDKSNSLQKWEGIVLELKEDRIIARLTNLDNPLQEDEAEIPLSELEPEDLNLIQPGSVFYWNIGYLDTGKGQRLRTSLIRFRRIPYITKKQIQGAAIDAEDLRQFINWE